MARIGSRGAIKLGSEAEGENPLVSFELRLAICIWGNPMESYIVHWSAM